MSSSKTDETQAVQELESIRTQINQVTDDSLESTRRMVDLVAKSEEAGINTLVMLDEQGEILNEIEQRVHNIDSEMNEAQKNLNQLDKCCGLCLLPWQRFHYKHGKPMNRIKVHDTEKPSPTTTQPGPHMFTKDATTKTGYINHITNDAREDEMDSNLDMVGNHIGTLKNIAIDMGNTLSNQNIQIQRIAEKTDVQIGRVDDANKHAQQILK